MPLESTKIGYWSRLQDFGITIGVLVHPMIRGEKMKKTFPLLLGAIIGATLVCGAPGVALAQDKDLSERKGSISVDQIDIRDALKLLLKSIGVDYIIAPEVQGTVTASFKDKPVEVILRNLLNQVNATYRLEGGIVQVVLREIDKGPTGGGGGDQPTTPDTPKSIQRRIYIKYADPLLVYLLLNGSSQPGGLPPEISTMSSGGGGGRF